MGRMNSIIAMFLLTLATASCTSAKLLEQDSYYFCPEGNGPMIFTDLSVTRIRGMEFPRPGYSLYAEPSAYYGGIADCSDDRYLCLRETGNHRHPVPDRGGLFTYAVPRNINIGDTYVRDDIEFKVAAHTVFPGERVVAIVTAIRLAEPFRGLEYKFFVEDKVGIHSFFYSYVRLHGRGGGTIHNFDHYTCSLVSGPGLLRGVRVNRPDEDNHQR